MVAGYRTTAAHIEKYQDVIRTHIENRIKSEKEKSHEKNKKHVLPGIL